MIFGGAQIITVLAAILRNKIAAITIGATGVGLSSIYIALSQFVANATNLGLPDSGVQTIASLKASDVNKDTSELRKGIVALRTWEVVTAVLSFLVMILFSPLLCRIYFGSTTSHLHSIMLLSLVPAAIIVNGVELAILKSLQATRLLTQAIIIAAIISVVISIPLYIYAGWNGIIFVIVASFVFTAIMTTILSQRLFPALPSYELITHPRALWKNTSGMVLLGLSFVITGIGSMSAELLTQTYFTTMASLAMVGLYKAGYQFSITYPSMIFTAVNNDYYPRLSAIGNNIKERNILVGKQIKALLIVTIPCITVFFILLPYIIPLMLSSEFAEITNMVRIGCLAVIIRCISIPICFIPLATGQKRDFVQMELCSNVISVLCIIIGYQLVSLEGIGIGIIISNVFDLIYGYILAKTKYGLKL